MDPLTAFVLSLVGLALLSRTAAAAGRALGLPPRTIAALQAITIG